MKLTDNRNKNEVNYGDLPRGATFFTGNNPTLYMKQLDSPTEDYNSVMLTGGEVGYCRFFSKRDVVNRVNAEVIITTYEKN